MSVRSRGQYVIKKQRASKRVTAEKRIYTIPHVGPYAALEAAEPVIGSAFGGYPTGYLVSDVSLEDTGGGSGKMVVTIEKPMPGTPSGPETTQIGETIYELDWAEERRPIEEHKKMPHLKADRLFYEYPDRKFSTGSNPGKTAAQADAATDKVYRQRSWDNWVSMDGGDVTGGTWTIDQYKSLKEKGYNDYPIAFPIASMTTYTRYRTASVGGVWTISTPPGSCGAPGGWTYVKTADRQTKQGRLYTRVQQWRGFNGTDALFFLA